MDEPIYPGQLVQILVDCEEHPAHRGLFGVVAGKQLPSSPYYPVVLTLNGGIKKNVLVERSQIHVC